MKRTRAQLLAWARSKTWIQADALVDETYPVLALEIVKQGGDPEHYRSRRQAYAECQGPHDPICGLARFSAHGCGNAPSRAELDAALEK